MEINVHCRQSSPAIIPVSTLQPVSQLANALRKQEATELTPTLVNYVNSRLVEHVSNWQADGVTKQVCG